MRAAVENDLSVTARRVVKVATENGWHVVGVWSTGQGELDGQPVLSLRGRRGPGRFVVVFVSGSVDGVWWWTRQHRAVVKGYREVEKTTKTNAWSVDIGKALKHDETLDEVVTWTSDDHVRTRLSSLAELVGVAKQPARAARPAVEAHGDVKARRAVTARGPQPAVPGLLSLDLDSTQE